MRVLSDRAEVLRACTVLFEPEQVVELRALECETAAWRRPHTVAGYFNDWEKLASAAAGLKARGVYVTLNPLLPALLARAENHLIDVGAKDPLASDADVTRRRWLPIDCDPVRPPGISASGEEHNLALQRAREVREVLGQLQWPQPVLADSGNGAHLLYRVELPAGQDRGGELVAGVLAALAQRFDDGRVTVDQKVFNPARIWKLYGTVAAKGDNTAERPHRLARIIDAPQEMRCVPRDALAGVARWVEPRRIRNPVTAEGNGRTGQADEKFELRRWIEKYRVPVGEERPWKTTGARRWEFPECPWNPAHKASAYIIQQPDGSIMAGCLHNSCREKRWRDLKALVEGAAEKEAGVPAAMDHPTYVSDGGRIWRITWGETREGKLVEVRRSVVADFAVQIVEESRAEDGQVWFTLAGVTAEGAAIRTTLPVEEFVSDRDLLAALTAVAGARGAVRAGMGVHLRPAIQMLTREDRLHTRCFGRTGWAEVNGQLRFLQPGRDVDGLQVRIRKQPYEGPGAAAAKTFAAEPVRREEVLAGFRSLLRSLDPRRTTVIATLMFQAPLGKLAGWLSDRYAIFIAGRTGSLKTSFAQTLMCLYGAEFASDQYLLKFGEGATRNAILSYAEQANDMVLLLDNFKPNTGDGSKGFVNLLHNLVEGGGRERLNQRAQLQESKPIECWPLLTGEDVPTGDAASMARLLVVTIAWPNGDHNAALAEAQAQRQQFPLLGAAWVDWLESAAGRAAAEEAGRRFEERRAGWASRMRESGRVVVNPLRVASNLASNELTWEVLERHPLLGSLAHEFAAAHAAGLALLMVEMARQTAENLEGVRFLEVLRQLLANGECVLLHRKEETRGPEEASRGDRSQVAVGWHAPGDGGYLLPDLARREVERVLGGDGLNRISSEALYGQLDALGYLESHEEGRRTKKLRVGASIVRVLHLTGRALTRPMGDAGGGPDSEPVNSVPAYPRTRC